MKCYIILQIYYDNTEIYGVYSDHLKAREIYDRLYKYGYGGYGYELVEKEIEV